MNQKMIHGTPLCHSPSPAVQKSAEDAILETLRPLARSIIEARAKHRDNRLLVEALAEELGEYAERGDAFQKFNRGALNVATMATRMFLEGVTPSPPTNGRHLSTSGLLSCWQIEGGLAREALRRWGERE